MNANRYSVSPRLPSRQESIRESRESQSPCDLRPQSPQSRTVTVHRIAIPQPPDKLSRSASMSESNNRAGWRCSLAKLMRANSTSGHCVSADAERKTQESCAEAAQPDEGHIEICVIQPTPAVSPCPSLRKLNAEHSVPSARSLCDRRKCFARTKAQTVHHPMDVPQLGSLLVPSGLDDYGPVIDPLCRSNSPRFPTNNSAELPANVHVDRNRRPTTLATIATCTSPH